MKKLSFAKSDELFELAERVIPGGSNKYVRKRTVMGGIEIQRPKFIDHAKGSRIWDVDGNEFIDYGGMGPTILGHGDSKVTEAVREQLKKGVVHFGLNYELDIKLSEKMVKSIPCAEQVHMLNTGSEATTAALRIARAYTEKAKVIKFDGHYHGIHDWTILNLFGGNISPRLISHGLTKGAVEDTIILQWQDLDSVERVLSNQGNEIAAIITEPYQFNGPCIIPEKGYLEGLRKITKKNDVLLIFDEIISGFRVALGGVQELEGVIPDIATYGKAMANGYPISAVASNKKIMETVTYGRVFLKGTYHSNPISTSAAYATITELERKESYKHLNKIGDSIIKGLKDAIDDLDIDAIVQGVGPCFTIIFTEQEKIMRTSDLRATIGVKTTAMAYPHDRRSAVFAKEMINQGILFQPTWRNHLYLAHNKEEADITIEAAQKALKQTKKIK